MISKLHVCSNIINQKIIRGQIGRKITLVERVTQTVLETLEDRVVLAIPDRSKNPRVWMMCLTQRLPLKRLKGGSVYWPRSTAP